MAMTCSNPMGSFRAIARICLVGLASPCARGFIPPAIDRYQTPVSAILSSTASEETSEKATSVDEQFQDFVKFLEQKQESIISEIEALENGATFCRDAWGIYDDNVAQKSGGITRVLQGGDIVEKGACSLTLIQDAILSEERAATIRARQSAEVSAGNVYSAAALSMVLHTRSPLVPTFRSDVRVFMVHGDKTLAWLGGGADLTPYYLDPDDIQSFHGCYKNLCDQYFDQDSEFSYDSMKQACDNYFYLPARSEHRGTGGIFFDDCRVTENTLQFVKGVADTWMPSWFPIVHKHRHEAFTDKQKQWQLIRRGRYLEFNLLYDRGVKFGLANANPRVEGVMVSAPPQIAYEYKHKIEPGSPEAELMQVLKKPRNWIE